MKLYNHQGRAIIVNKIEWKKDMNDTAIIYGKFKDELLSENLDKDVEDKRFSTSSLGKFLFYKKNEIEFKDNIEVLRNYPKYSIYSGKIQEILNKQKQREIELNNFHDYLYKNYGFDGFIHTTDFSNFINIMKTRCIYSRAKVNKENLFWIDSADKDIIENTTSDVKNSVRFYFRPKTPTHYNNEGIRPNNPDHHMGIPVILRLGRGLYSDFNGTFYDGNAKTHNTIKTNDIVSARKFNFNRIFSKGPYGVDSYVEHKEITRQRNAELLIPNEISIEYIDKIIFRSMADFKMTKVLVGDDPRFTVDHSKFYNDYLYCKDYKIEISYKTIQCMFMLNRGNIPYIRQFAHIIKLKYRGQTKEYDIFDEGGIILYESYNWYVTITLLVDNYEELEEVEYLIDKHVSAIWRRKYD